jgi:hypothetical protein
MGNTLKSDCKDRIKGLSQDGKLRNKVRDTRGFPLQIQSDSTSNHNCARRATPIVVCDPPLVVCCSHQVVGTAKAKKADWSGPHRTAVAGRWRWCARFIPRNSPDQPIRGCLGREASSDDAIFTKERCDTACVIDRVELAKINNT